MKTLLKFIALLPFIMLVGCGGSESVTKSGETVTTVEDHSIGGDGDGTQSHGAMDSAGFDSSDLTDPDSPLSVRVIYFEYDSSEVLPDYRSAVEAHAAYLAGHPEAIMTLEGHADERGSREYNLALGEYRANALKRQMVLLGAADAQIQTVSFGEEQPADDGHSEESYSLNRRVEIVY